MNKEKIYLSCEEDRRRFQEHAFKLGYGWFNEGKKIMCLRSPYFFLNADNDFAITMSHSDSMFLSYEADQIFLDEFLERNPPKRWPPSPKEAKKESHFWGFEIDDVRYMIITHGTSGGCAVRPQSTWATADDMEYYWKGNGIDPCHGEYSFHKFDSERGLLQWMLEAVE